MGLDLPGLLLLLPGQPPFSFRRDFNLLSLSLFVPFHLQEKSSGRTAHYKLTSTVMLWLQTNKTGSGTMNLGGSLTRQVWLCPAVLPWLPQSSPSQAQSVAFVRCCINISSPAVLQPSEMGNAVCNYQKAP